MIANDRRVPRASSWTEIETALPKPSACRLESRARQGLSRR